MKIKILLLVAVLGLAGAAWFYTHQHPAAMPAAGGRKILYYTCAMHPSVRESKPGPCPVCGMNLTPVFENQAGAGMETNSAPDMVTLEPGSISTINVQTDLVDRRPVRRSLHFSGQISWNSSSAAWFEFTVYQRDIAWLKIGQTLQVVVTGAPEKIYTAQIKLHGVKPFADPDFDMMTGSTTVRAEISNPPVVISGLGTGRLFNGLHADAHLVVETGGVLTIPRSSVISRGTGSMVYVAQGEGHYKPQTVELGRMGDELAEVLSGLKAGEKVVTTGNVLIDSEAQLTAGQ